MVGILQTLDKKVGKASSKNIPSSFKRFLALQVPSLQNKVNWDNWDNCYLTIYIIRVTLNTEFDTLLLSPVNFQSAGSILTNDTLAERRGLGASS